MNDKDPHPERPEPTESGRSPLRELAPKGEAQKRAAMKALVDEYRDDLDSLAR